MIAKSPFNVPRRINGPVTGRSRNYHEVRPQDVGFMTVRDCYMPPYPPAAKTALAKAKTSKIVFSYATPDQPVAMRSMIRTVEFLGGKRRLANLYKRYAKTPGVEDRFFEAAVELLKLDVRYDQTKLDLIPRDEPVLFIANHPYGVIDGVVLTWLARKARSDVKVLTHKVLCQAPEAGANLLPIDFSETPEALQNNIRSRRLALDILRDKGAIGIFPAGAVSASEGPWRGPAVDIAWHPFSAKLLMMSKATVVPIYFAGQNSRLFQLASHASYTCRLSLFFWETARRMGTRMEVGIGDPIPYAELAHLDNRKDLLRELRRRTYALASTIDGEGPVSPDKLPAFDREYVFPRHFNL